MLLQQQQRESKMDAAPHCWNEILGSLLFHKYASAGGTALKYGELMALSHSLSAVIQYCKRSCHMAFPDAQDWLYISELKYWNMAQETPHGGKRHYVPQPHWLYTSWSWRSSGGSLCNDNLLRKRIFLLCFINSGPDGDISSSWNWKGRERCNLLNPKMFQMSR